MLQRAPSGEPPGRPSQRRATTQRRQPHTIRKRSFVTVLRPARRCVAEIVGSKSEKTLEIVSGLLVAHVVLK